MSDPIITTVSAKSLGWRECPRCWRWTPNDGPEYGEGKRAGIICWRCQDVLVHDHPDHPVTRLVVAWREERGLPV